MRRIYNIYIHIYIGHADVVRILIAHIGKTETKEALRAAINHTNVGNGETALYIACTKGYVDVVAALMATDLADTNLLGISSKCVGFSYGQNSKFEVNVSTLPLKAAVNGYYYPLTSILHPRISIIEKLLEDPNIDVNLTGNVPAVLASDLNVSAHSTSARGLCHDGRTPLASACDICSITCGGWRDPAWLKEHAVTIIQEQLHIIKLLVNHPTADVNVQCVKHPDWSTSGPRHTASTTVSDAVVVVETPLSIVCQSNPFGPGLCSNKAAMGDANTAQFNAINSEIVEVLLDAGANKDGVYKMQTLYPEMQNVFKGVQGGWPLLHLACINCNVPVVKVLIERGADVNAYTQETVRSGMRGVTPLIAVLTNNDEDSSTPFCSGALKIIQLLLDNGADPHLVGTEIASGVDIIPLHAALQWPAAALALLNSTGIPFDVRAPCPLVSKYDPGDVHGTTVCRGYTPLHLAVEGNDEEHYFDGYTGTGRGSGPGWKYKQVSDHRKGCMSKLLVKLLSYEGSSGKVDVSTRLSRYGTAVLYCGRHNSLNVAIMLMTCKDLEIDAVSTDTWDDSEYTVLQRLCADIDCYSRFQQGYSQPAAVQLLVAFGASLTRRDAMNGKTAIELVAGCSRELVPNWVAVHLHDWFTKTSGWSPIECGAGCRFHVEILTAVQNGVMDLDGFEVQQLKRALAIAKMPPTELGWHAAPDICMATVLLMNAAVKSWHKGWIPAGHWLFHSKVRSAVHTVLLVASRLQRLQSQDPGAGSAALTTSPTASLTAQSVGAFGGSARQQQSTENTGAGLLPLLPPEIWQFIMHFFQRQDWAVPALDEGVLLKLLNLRCIH